MVLFSSIEAFAGNHMHTYLGPRVIVITPATRQSYLISALKDWQYALQNVHCQFSHHIDVRFGT